jgi:hypothetical protein
MKKVKLEIDYPFGEGSDTMYFPSVEKAMEYVDAKRSYRYHDHRIIYQIDGESV